MSLVFEGKKSRKNSLEEYLDLERESKRRRVHCDTFTMCAVLLRPVQYSPLLCCSMIRTS